MVLTLLLLLQVNAWGTEGPLFSDDLATRAAAYRDVESEGAAAVESLAGALAVEQSSDLLDVGTDAMMRVDLTDEELVGLLASPTAVARAWAAHSLGRRPTESNRLALEGALGDESALVRGELYTALERHADRGSLRALQRAATREPDPNLQEQAIETARSIISSPGPRHNFRDEVERLTRGAALDRREAIVNLTQLGWWSAFPHLARAATTGPVQPEAAYALGELGDHRAVEILARLLGESDLRREALAALAKLANDGAVPAISELLAEADPEWRLHATRALSWIGSERALVAAGRLASDPELEVRTEVLHAVDKLEGERGATALAPFLTDESPFLRAEAATRIGEHRGTVLAPQLRTLLEDEDPYVSLSAAAALVALADVDSIPHLERLLERTEDEEQRPLIEAAIESLRGEPPTGPSLPDAP